MLRAEARQFLKKTGPDPPSAAAISAGLLPVVLGEGSWWYPLSILFGTSLLAVSLLVYRKLLAGTIESIPEWLTSVEDDLVEQAPSQYAWLPFFVLFLVLGLMLVGLVLFWRVRARMRRAAECPGRATRSRTHSAPRSWYSRRAACSIRTRRVAAGQWCRNQGQLRHPSAGLQVVLLR